MSVKVTAWVLESVHLPGDPIAKLVLLALAEHANPDGTAAWPPQARLADYADVSIRTVRTKIRALEELGLISSGDQQLVDHLPSNRRPHVWDIDMAWEVEPGRNAASGQKDLPGGNSLPPKERTRAEAGRTFGRKLSSYKPSLEPSIDKDSLRSSLSARGARATRLDPEWMPDPELIAKMRVERPDVDLKLEHSKFVDFWIAKPGKDGTKLDWPATWRNWIRNAKPTNGNGHNRYALKRQEETDQHFARMLEEAREIDRRREAQAKEIAQ